MSELPLFSWKPPQKVVIFPSDRNRQKIFRAASIAAAAKNPEPTIRALINRARTSYQQRGLPADLIERDLAALDEALRSQVAILRSKKEASL